jgi:glucokinase
MHSQHNADMEDYPVMSDKTCVIAIDLGGTKIASALLGLNGHKIDHDTVYLEEKTGQEVGALIVHQVEDLLSKANVDNKSLRATGISVPGIYYSETGHVWAPNIAGWEDYPLLAELEELLEPHDIPVFIAGDRACYILGETWLGAAKGCRDAIYIAVGTGIGAGMMVDGRILKGMSDISGAIGWLALDRPFQEKYINCGCFEYHASGAGIAKVARSLLGEPRFQSSSLHSTGTDELTAQHIFEAYHDEDPLAVHVLNECIEFWGMAAANLVSLFNPEKIIFGGGVFGPGVQFLDQIRTEAAKWAQPISMQQVAIEVSRLGGDAGLLGAANLALRNIQHREDQ